MRLNRSFQRTVQNSLLVLDILLLLAAFYVLWAGTYNSALPIPFFRRGNYILYAIYAVLLFAFITLMKGHRIGSMRVTEIMLSQGIAILLANIVIYLQVSLLSYRLAAAGGFLLMSLAQLLLMGIWVFLGNRLYFRIFPPLKMLMVYDDPEKVCVAAKLNVIRERYCIGYYLDISSEKDRIAAIMDEYPAVLLAVRDPAIQEWLINLCYQKQKRLYFVPNTSDVIKNGAWAVHAVDTPLLLCRNGQLSSEERMWKRLMDFTCALLGIVLLSPVMLLSAAAIFLYDRRNVIYAQARLTKGGKVFRLYKFRSMVVDAEAQGVRLATADDERITPVGRVLRKYRIDELPQLFNILKGDMSLVGPRPERPEIAAEYEKLFPAFRYRLNVKAGLTGNAQVYGNYDTSWEDKLLMDLMYIENYTFLHDMSLLFQTLRIILTPSRAQGFRPQDLPTLPCEKQDSLPAEPTR